MADPLGQGLYAAGNTPAHIEHDAGDIDRDNTWEQHPFFIVWVLLTKTAYVADCTSALIKMPNCVCRKPLIFLPMGFPQVAEL
ncbi:hypothetical protein [Bacillus sp. MUM 13]|uniref:hypothetical protein n=1 Tax=Bacillus sp. MUM 13 TaxID=1678001 RepID=UPI0008F5A8F3|nr:hypothetical protein [Bacillus sp. MUM 13]OIK14914.1 hypothetical protein BIV59_01670 [Bacillus sp. MUM 13]